MYDRILVPTDGSDGAHTAFEHGLALAERFGADLHVLHAVDPSLIPPEVGAERVIDALRESAQDDLRELRRRGESMGIETETTIVDGGPHDAVLAFVDEHDIDLVVMGTHGRTGLGRWLLGSVTERVVRTCPVPVLTVRVAEEAEDRP